MKTENSARDRASGNPPVFGGRQMRGGRPDYLLPVNLNPTAMAAEMRGGGLSLSGRPRKVADCGEIALCAEMAEVIGQEELPLRAALSWARNKSDGSNIAEPKANVVDVEKDSPLPRGEPAELASGGSAVASHLGSSVGPILAQEPGVSLPTVQVALRAVPGRSGRPVGIELYPFAKLEPIAPDAKGNMTGPSFLIPTKDLNHIAAARKRHKSKTFITRKVPGGKMVWRQS